MAGEHEQVELGPIGQIAITVRALQPMVAFYRDVLGLPFLFAAPPNMAFFQAGPVRLMLAEAAPADAVHPASILYYTVRDLPAVHRALEARGAAFESKPHFVAKLPDHELWLAFLRDPEHNLVGLMSEVR